jgi:cytochrome d ubiquinol oxidase subunit II
VTLFVDLYPRVMVSSTNPAYSLTAANSASPPYTLKVMTVIAVVLLPLVLGYQAWTYYVFRQRVSVHHFRPAAPAPAMPPVPAQAPATEARRAPAAAGGRRRRQHRSWRGNRS